MQFHQNTLLTLNMENLPYYQNQLLRIGITEDQVDLSNYIGTPIRQIQQMINSIRLSYMTKKPR